jgi:hypothetical protein
MKAIVFTLYEHEYMNIAYSPPPQLSCQATDLSAWDCMSKYFIYHACHVTLRVCPHRESLKNMPGHGKNRTYAISNISPMLCQVTTALRGQFGSSM